MSRRECEALLQAIAADLRARAATLPAGHPMRRAVEEADAEHARRAARDSQAAVAAWQAAQAARAEAAADDARTADLRRRIAAVEEKMRR